MKKVLTVLLILFAGLAFGVNLVAEEGSNDNMVEDGGVESFYIHESGDITLPRLFGEDFNHFRMGTFGPDGNSLAIITKDGDNAYAKMQYDGVSAGNNSNLWIYTFDLNQGAGDYTVSFDLKIEGFSTGDFFGFIMLGVNGALNVQKDVAYNLDAYEALPDSAELPGWKHVSYVITQTAEQAENNDTLTFNLYNKQDEFIIANLDNVSVKKDNVELLTVNSQYVGDFECYYQSEVILGTEEKNGFSVNETDSAAKVVKDGANNVLKLEYSGDDKNTAGFFANIGETAPGVYQIEMDIKYPNNLDTNRIGYRLVSDVAGAVSAERTIATGIASLNQLEDSETLAGYKHFVGTVTVEKFAANHIDKIYVSFNTKGLANNYILIDNLSVKLIDQWQIKEVPSVDNLEFTDLVIGGDFEDMEVGYSFVSEPQEDVHFWGTMALDSPGTIVTVDDTKALKLSYDGARHFASAFVFLDPLSFDKDHVYELTFKYKINADPAVGKAFHVSFVGPTGQENYKVYLNYNSAEDKFTNGVNSLIYPYTLTDGENGWKIFTMKFQLNDTFMSNVDSLRFLINTMSSEENYVFIDDVKFGYYAESEAVDPTPDAPEGGQGLPVWAIASIVVGSIVVVAGGAFVVVFLRRRKK